MELIKKIAGDSFYELVIKLVSIGCLLGFNALVARGLDIVDVGLYFLYFSLVQIGVVFFLFGLDKKVVFLISEWRTNEDYSNVVIYARILFWFIVLSPLVIFLILFIIANTSLEKTFKLDSLEVLVLISAWFWLVLAQRIICQFIRGYNKVRYASILESINYALSFLILGICFIVKTGLSLQLIIVVIIFSYFISVFVGLVSSFRLIRTDQTKNYEISEIKIKNVFDAASYLYVQSIIMILMSQGQIWLINYFESPKEVAIYGAVIRLIIPITASLLILRRVLSPRISHFLALGKNRELEGILRLTTTGAGVVSLSVFVIILVPFGEFILSHVFGNEYADGYTALLIITGSHIINVFTGLPGVMLTAMGKERILVLSSLITGIVTYVICFLLIDKMSYDGVALGVATGLILNNMIMTYSVWSISGIKTFFSLSSFWSMFFFVRNKVSNRSILVDKKFFILLEKIFRLFDWILTNLKGQLVIECYGDSHVKGFRLLNQSHLKRKYYFRTYAVQGATVSGLENPKSKTNAVKAFKYWLKRSKAAWNIVMLGEVDFGFLMWYKHENGKGSIDDLYHEVKSKYFSFLESINKDNLVVSSVILPTIDYSDNPNSDIGKFRSSIQTKLSDRTALTLRFNSDLKNFCRDNKIIYLDLDLMSLDHGTGVIRQEFVKKNKMDHHYEPNMYKTLLTECLKTVL